MDRRPEGERSDAREDLREDPRDDRALLQAHVAGDPEAFGLLFARHRDRLWAVAVRTSGNREDAADGLQDAMVSAFRRAGSYRGDAAVTTWLHRVVVNACLDRIRAAGVRRAEPLPDDLEEYARAGAVVSGQSAFDGARDPGDPVETTLRHEQRELLLAALAELPAEQRAAVVLVDVEGLSVAEAAQVLECAEGTVKSRCSRGRRRLAAHLSGNRPGPRAVTPQDGPRSGAGPQVPESTQEVEQ